MFEKIKFRIVLRGTENVQKQTSPGIFLSGQLLGSEFQHNIAPFGVSGSQFTAGTSVATTQLLQISVLLRNKYISNRIE
jgi:hypothetical protein